MCTNLVSPLAYLTYLNHNLVVQVHVFRAKLPVNFLTNRDVASKRTISI